MKRINLIILMQYILLTAFGQSTNQQLHSNLKKYWYYRNRLVNFVKVSSSVSEARIDAGSNIPIEKISLKKDSLFFDDGNGALCSYISVLATEYRLLKNYNQDYNQTVQQLYYALLTFNRLDSTAEMYFQKTANLNGFFVRNDFTRPFWIKYGKNGTYNNGKGYFCVNNLNVSNLLEPNNTQSLRTHENSEDNCYHMLEALSLVNTLVDNEIVDGSERNFKNMAKSITQRIIGNLYHPDQEPQLFEMCAFLKSYCAGLRFNWYAMNLATNELIYQGNGITDTTGKKFDGTMLFMSYGFAQAANKIIGSTYFNGMDQQELLAPSIPLELLNPMVATVQLKMPSSESLFKTLLSAPLSSGLIMKFALTNKICAPGYPYVYADIELDGKELDGSSYRKILDDYKLGYNNGLCYGSSYSDTVKTYSIKNETWNSVKIAEDDYRWRSVCATGNINLPNKNSYQILIEKQNLDTLFKYEHLPLIWSINNSDFTNISDNDRLFVLNLLNIAPACGPHGRNLSPSDYVYQWSSDHRLVWPECKGDTSSTEFNGLDYMLLHNLYWLTNPVDVPKDYNPLNIGILWSNTLVPYITYTKTASNDIVSSQSFNLNNNNINIYAGNSITLQPGFETAGTGNVYLDISEVTTTNEPVYFHKISLSGYDTCPDRLK